MREVMTKSMARNIFYGGSLFFILIFVGLTAQSHLYIVNTSTDKATLTPSVAAGKHLWEKHACINCHTILGEGAYFAPELGNVYARRGPDFIKGWIKAMPTNTPGRRQMPQFNFTDAQLEDLTEFLRWTNGIDTEKWPPNIEG